MATPAWELIDSNTLSSSASSVTFSGIPGTYRDIIAVIEISNSTASNAQVYCRLNSDSGTNYSIVVANGYGTGYASATETSVQQLNIGKYVAVNNGEYNLTTAQFLDYSATDKHKSVLSRSDAPDVGTSMIAGRWASTSAITSIEIYPSGGEFTTGSFYLWGLNTL